jgi:hypothetical protein
LDEPAASDPWGDPPTAAEAEEIRAAVRASLAALPGVQRAAIELAYFGGLSQNEIAQATGVPLGTIKSRIRFGMMALHRRLSIGSRPTWVRSSARHRGSVAQPWPALEQLVALQVSASHLLSLARASA